MPSPFPGMDPYLENPGLWPDVHHELISTCRQLLNEQLRPNYYVRVEERVYVSDDTDPGRVVRVPDLHVVARSDGPRREEGGVALEVADPIEAVTWVEEEVHETYLTIVDRMSREVVTVIEVVSPTNKVRGSAGRQSYEQKRAEVIRSPTHWVEIDLLRGGDRLTVVPPRYHRQHEYLAHVSPARRRPIGLLWPIRLSQRLPVLSIPLRPADPDAALDLQSVLTIAYDRANYDLELDYRAEPDPPLDPPWAEWADRLLKEKGLR